MLLVPIFYDHHPYIVGGIGVSGRIKMTSASTISANEPDMDLILVHSTANTNDKLHIEEWYNVM